MLILTQIVCASCPPWCAQQLCESLRLLCSAMASSVLCSCTSHWESLVPNVVLTGLGCLLLGEESTMARSHVGSIRDGRCSGTSTPGTQASCPSSLYYKSWLEKSCRKGEDCAQLLSPGNCRGSLPCTSPTHCEHITACRSKQGLGNPVSCPPSSLGWISMMTVSIQCTVRNRVHLDLRPNCV